MIDPTPSSALERVAIAMFAALPPTIASVAALIYALRAYKEARRSAAKIDGRMDQLLDEARGKARLEGALEEQQHSGTNLGRLPPPAPPQT